MASKGFGKNYIIGLCVVLAGLVVASFYVIGCVQQQRGKYQQERDKRDHVKGQVQPVPHELNK
ncbi:MAG: hypothetical protein IT367_08660 [Candidatus Hydrogenedentes bacterium]|nr:hypothetical protein [Candidatus Hydrogenedentota bacterium]